jgi:alkanesulfonate monooxygenase SsuD/methylene tetrahydromethanopterin reductase-like flavin-dependent oxidoreductase (luciferase family)
VTLGVGVGWYRDEFELMGVRFEGRDRRADEMIRLMRALWRGDRSFEGRWWSFNNATSTPLPSPHPKIWIGGSSPHAIRRARDLGDVWHPSRGSDVEHVRRIKEEYPDLRIVPRIKADTVDAMLAAGADGAVVALHDEEAMEAFLRRYR